MIHQYLEYYKMAGFQCSVSALFDDRYFAFQVLDKPTSFGEILRHASYYFERVSERLRQCLTCQQYDLVVFEKELLPYFPYGLEAVLKHLQAKTVVLFDDATYNYYRQHHYGLVRLLCSDKIERIIQNSDHVIVWNEYLGDHIRQLNPNVSIVNSGIDLRRYRVKSYDHDFETARNRPVVIGWIGTPNSFPYIRMLEETFARLTAQYSVELHIISSQSYSSDYITVVNKQWSLQTEVDDLLCLDIGIMPLPDNEWTRGKSGVKAIQYMGVGVPVVCSHVGVVNQLIQDGVNGFTAARTQDWEEKLSLLIENPGIRQEMGLKGRETIESSYSIQAVAPQLINILGKVGGGI